MINSIINRICRPCFCLTTLLYPALLILLLVTSSCRSSTGPESENENREEVPHTLYADFDEMAYSFYGNTDGMNYEIVDNPEVEKENRSSKSGKIATTDEEYEALYSEELPGTFNFDEGTSFSVKVYTRVPGNLYLKIEDPDDYANQPLEVKKEVSATNEWTRLTFDFSSFETKQDFYGRVVLLFDAGSNRAGNEWYFDDLRGPPLEMQESLMKRYEQNPVLQPAPGTWYGVHIANAAIITPDESPTGKWMMYARGSGYVPEYHDQIGLFTQELDSFSPYGPWEEYEDNPVLPYGEPGSYDDRHLLDADPVPNPSDTLYFYYKAQSTETDRGAVGGALSIDNGYTFEKFEQPVKMGTGSPDGVYHDGSYYLFHCHGDWEGGTFSGPLRISVMKTANPEHFLEETNRVAVPAGGGPGNFDSASVCGPRVFRINGVDKWFMVYQGSDRHIDFPERFHVAYSDDLVNWTKVQNDRPFFRRGMPGRWDQGAIWYGEVFEYNGTLYMYYEGWGADRAFEDRNNPYFGYGISQTGVAETSVEKFLEWCGL